MKNKVRIAVIGGAGFWSEQNHHKHILEIKYHLPVELGAIVDIIDPRNVKTNRNMQRLLSIDKTTWLNPKDFSGTDKIIRNLKDKHKIDLVIIASNPCTHFDYGLSCLKHRIHVICDKPIVTNYNSSTDIAAASTIKKQFNNLLNTYKLAKKDTPKLLFHSILRRRSLKPFTRVAKELSNVYKQTGAGINNMTILVNGGIYKLPIELSASGSHGYLDGVGSLSHSAYHYLDVFSWFISQAPGKITKIIPKLNYALRIKDYLKNQGYKPLAKMIKTNKNSLLAPTLDKKILGCELNCGFTFLMQDENETQIGTTTFLFNHLSFSPRINVYDESKYEPANHKGGGRTSYFFINVNQSGLQGWQITKNDIVFEGNNILIQVRRHPLIKGSDFESHLYKNAYEPEEIGMKDLLCYTVEHVMSKKT